MESELENIKNKLKSEDYNITSIEKKILKIEKNINKLESEFNNITSESSEDSSDNSDEDIDIAKIIKKLPPELMDSFSRDVAKLGEEKADIKEFDDLFKKVMEKAEIALERDREDKRKAKEFEKANAPKKIEKCKCDFLPNLPAYKNVTCERTDCVKKI